MTVVATGRRHVSEVLKGTERLAEEAGFDVHFATVNARRPAGADVAIDPVGTLLKWNGTAFTTFSPNADWAASTAYAVGDVVKPATQNGLEYVCIVAGTSNDTEGEPTFPTVPGATVTETDGVVWLARFPYGKDKSSPLPEGNTLCISVGDHRGIDRNSADVTLTTSDTKVTAVHRGDVGVVTSQLKVAAAAAFSTLSADDQAEVQFALEQQGFVFVTEATATVPSYVG